MGLKRTDVVWGFIHLTTDGRTADSTVRETGQDTDGWRGEIRRASKQHSSSRTINMAKQSMWRAMRGAFGAGTERMARSKAIRESIRIIK